MNREIAKNRAAAAYLRCTRVIGASLFLLVIRIVWGWQFYETGAGKLKEIARPIHFFTELHIPFPTANAWFVSILEAVGGIMLLLGIGSRAIAFLLAGDMVVAYITADRDSFLALFKDGDVTKFSGAQPFWFLMATWAIFTFGPGLFSIDGIIKCVTCRGCCKRNTCEITPGTPVSAPRVSEPRP